MYKNIVDLHVHTDNSFDGNHSATFFCEKAEFLDLRAVAFTDHCEVDQFRGNRQYEKRIFQAFFEIFLFDFLVDFAQQFVGHRIFFLIFGHVGISLQ